MQLRIADRITILRDGRNLLTERLTDVRDMITRAQGFNMRIDMVVIRHGSSGAAHFLAERIASSPPEDPWLILVAELDSEPVGYAFLLSKGVNAGGRAMADLYVLPTARGRGAGRALLEALTAETAAHGLPGFLLSLPDDDLISLGTARHWGLQVAGHPHDRDNDRVSQLDSLRLLPGQHEHE